MPKKILLVDDERDILEIYKSRISSWGYDALIAENAEEAIKILKETKIDTIILDYLMPDMDGITLLKKIREVDKKIPAIMFTAYSEETAIKDADKLDIAAFIPKTSPYTNTIDSLKKTLEIIFKKEK